MKKAWRQKTIYSKFSGSWAGGGKKNADKERFRGYLEMWKMCKHFIKYERRRFHKFRAEKSCKLCLWKTGKFVFKRKIAANQSNDFGFFRVDVACDSIILPSLSYPFLWFSPLRQRNQQKEENQKPLKLFMSFIPSKMVFILWYVNFKKLIHDVWSEKTMTRRDAI